MMIELYPEDFSEVYPLLYDFPQAVLPYAICEGINPGRVFTDFTAIPQPLLIWSPVGYYFLAGEPSQLTDYAEIRRVLTEVFVPASREGGENGFILIPSTPAWQTVLPQILPGRKVIQIYRRPFQLNPAMVTAAEDWLQPLPPGFELRLADAAIAEKMGVLASWASVDDFLTNGIGVALLEGEALVSTCYSVYSSHRAVEIDIHTHEKYRRRGFALTVAAAFLEECLRRGKQPNWECFWDNEPSARLAGRLGFSPLADYPVYYWEE